MRKTAGLVLIILTVLVLTNMPAFKGLSVIQLNRPSDLPVGEDPGGALGIVGLDQGLNGAIIISGNAASDDRYMGTITNNFDFPIQLNITLVIRAVITGRGNPRWQNINIFFDKDSNNGVIRVATLNFTEVSLGSSEQQRMTDVIVLNPGEALIVSLDRNSRLFQNNNINFFQADASFYIAGSSSGDENISFTIEPIDDLRKQYITK